MVKCEKCGKKHDGSFGSGRFCSAACCSSFAGQQNKGKTKIVLCFNCGKEFEAPKTSWQRGALCAECKNKGVKNIVYKKEYTCKWCSRVTVTTAAGNGYHENHCIANPDRKIVYWVGKHLSEESKKKIGKKNRMGLREVSSIKDISKRTVSKIVARMKLGCSRCGWDLGRCDFHHILPKGKGGPDNHTNLAYICPNCHRLVHQHKILSSELISVEKYLGTTWKDFYYGYKDIV